MQDIVVVPCYRRPEFLVIWMELIAKARNAEDMFYIFCLDDGYAREYDQVIKTFPFAYGVITVPRSRYKLGKQSFNVLNGLLAGAKHSKNLVFYIEEDVFIGRDFFEFHTEVHHQRKDIFCSLGTRNNNTKYQTDDSQEHYYLTFKPDYQALGSCFTKEIITKHIAPHFTDDYFTDPVKYCKDTFPKSSIGKFYTEQDGLIRRIIEVTGLPLVFPHVPRAFHAGMYGYNRPDYSIGKLSMADKIQKIRDTAFDKDALMSYVKHPEYFTDSEPIDLETSFDVLELVEALQT